MRKQARRKYICASVGFLMIIFVNSCKVTRQYQLPPGATADNLYRDSSHNDSANNIATISWRQMFTDTSLQSLIQDGINNNFDLKIAMARLKSAAANFKQSKLQFYPGVDANASATYQRVPSTQFGFPQTYSIGITTSWEADVWGQLRSAKKAALASLLQSEAYKRAVQTQLVSDIVTNYYALLAYEAQLRVTEKTVANRATEVETMKALKESNVVTGAAVVQSEANRYSVEITIPDLKQN
ncbi:MAG TPA: TolC family protein, partial [Puia sp.]|nr:TolC family protein [Puia sp.]